MVGLAERGGRAPRPRRAPPCRPSRRPGPRRPGGAPTRGRAARPPRAARRRARRRTRPSSRATCTVAPASSPRSSAGAASTSWVRATTNSAQRAGLTTSASGDRAGRGSPAGPRRGSRRSGRAPAPPRARAPARWRVGQLVRPRRAGRAGVQVVVDGVVVERRSPRRRGGPRALRGSCRIAWRWRSPDWAAWFPADQTRAVDELTALALAAADGRSGGDRRRSCAAPSPRCGGCAPGSATAPTPTTSPRRCTCGPCPALARFRGDASARTWLLQITRHVCADHVRRSTRRRALARPARAARRPSRPGRGPAHRRARARRGHRRR